MSGANYEYCPGCDSKALYVCEEDVPEGVEVWHGECRVRRFGSHPASCECDTCTAPAEARMLLANPVPPDLDYDPDGDEPANRWLTRALRLLRIVAGATLPSSAVTPLHADPAITCQATADARPHQPLAAGGCTLCVTEDGGSLPLCTEECTDYDCTAVSRYVVERSDGDESFGWDGKHESCEAHLADVVSGMASGDDIRAVVTIRWDQEADR